MIRFKTFLTDLSEAKFNPNSMNKVAQLLNNAVSKKTGKKFYRYGGYGGSIPLSKNGTGYLFFTTTRYAYQINSIKGDIKSLYIWKKWEHDMEPDFVIPLSDHNIVDVLDSIVDIIKSPKITKGKMNEEDGNTFVRLLEAKRIKPEEFAAFAKEEFDDISNLDRGQLDIISNKHNVSIPTPVHHTRSGKSYDLTKLGKSKGDVAPGSTLFVLGRGADGKMFKPTSEQAQAAVENHVAAANDPNYTPTKEEIQDPDTMFGNLASLIKVVVKGKQPSLLVFGGAGIGKSFTVEETIKELGLTKNKDFSIVTGKATPAGIYKTLFLNRDKLIVFDDSDSVFADETSRNLLKAALDSKLEKTISWLSARTTNISGMTAEEQEEFIQTTHEKLSKGEDAKLPSSFDYAGKIIFISNLDKNKIEPAILSRGFKIDMTLTDENIFKRMASILQHIGGGEFDNVPMETKEVILAELQKMGKLGKLERPNMRTFIAATRVYESGVPNWQEMMQYA